MKRKEGKESEAFYAAIDEAIVINKFKDTWGDYQKKLNKILFRDEETYTAEKTQGMESLIRQIDESILLWEMTFNSQQIKNTIPQKVKLEELKKHLQKKIQEIETSQQITELPNHINIKHKKNIYDFIENVKDKGKFLNDFKSTFKVEIGIPLKIIIELLKDEGIILIGNREFTIFYLALGAFLNRDIGSYQSINDNYKHSETDKKSNESNIDSINNRLKSLISKHKQTT